MGRKVNKDSKDLLSKILMRNLKDRVTKDEDIILFKSNLNKTFLIISFNTRFSHPITQIRIF
jgi:hypothetical protein